LFLSIFAQLQRNGFYATIFFEAAHKTSSDKSLLQLTYNIGKYADTVKKGKP
jgi:hypothetical protein